MVQGYYRFPTICGDGVAFVCEDDLWVVSAEGGTARRLTTSVGAVSRAFFSPDGEWLAFTGSDEGPTEIYVMPAAGGEATRLTYLGAGSTVAGWTPDGKRVVFTSNAKEPMARVRSLFTVEAERPGLPEPVPVGPASAIAYGPGGAAVLGRHSADPARWKRYRGGTAGELWIDRKGNGQYERLIALDGNLASPMWIGRRVFFLSDHEGIGNLYSCTPTGKGLRRHTDCEEFYLRNPVTDGRRVVFHAGADLFLYDPKTDARQRLHVDFRSPRAQCQRKFVDAAAFLDGFALHPKGHSVALTSRGKLFSMALWEGAVRQHGGRDGVRQRHGAWLNDGERVLSVTDETGEERLQIHRADLSDEPVVLDKLDVGAPHQLNVSPTADLATLCNHRCELVLVNLKRKTLKVIDRSPNGRISGGRWSPDGRWIAYSYPNTPETRCLKLYDTKTRKTHQITEPVLADFAPAWDPDGQYLYFLGIRDLDPVYDSLHFDLNFPRGVRPYLITLRKDLPSPFVPVPRAPGEKAEDAKKDDKPKGKKGKTAKKEEPKPVAIDLDGIEHRVVAFPVPLGRYGQIAGLPGGKVLFTIYPVEGTLGRHWSSGDAPKGELEMWDFDKQEKQTLVSGIGGFTLSADGKTMLYASGHKLRALKAGEKPDEKSEGAGPGRKSGWLDLGRVRVSVDPQAEWRQMYREAWRLQRDHFWTADMSKVDWQRVYRRYLPVLERVGARSEFSDLMWEMQGELGTSHAYEMGGDYRAKPVYTVGHLAAELRYDRRARGFRVVHVIRGDSWDPAADSPLNAPGICVGPGAVLRAVDGVPLTEDAPPGRLLVHRADTEVLLTVAERRTERTVSVKALPTEQPARYREWVETTRQRVHRETKGRVGYLHIPDMGARGYAEFHRLYLAEFDRGGLIVDVRCNGGGHVSQLLLEKLARKRIGYDLPRWGAPDPYPAYSVPGPIVAVTDELAGSDGDIFSHCFKLMKLGTLIGKRTWGGVIGISPRRRFVDGGLTTQPEYSFWFKDVGWAVENYGTDPDIEVDITPQDHAADRDTQLDFAIELILKQLAETPPDRPDFSRRPSLALPKLPPRDG